MHEKVKKIIEYIIVFILLLLLCFYINRNIIIKALYMDDLYSWSWFPGLNLFEYAFKFYGSSRYRPVFDAIQYIEYFVVQNRVYIFAVVNKVLNTLVALFIYHFAIRLKAKKIISFLVAFMYVVTHFSYYQIGQVIGLLETEAQFFALLILFLSLKLVGVIDRNNNEKKVLVSANTIITFFMILMYFTIAFTHERYLSLLPVIMLSIFFAKGINEGDKKKIFRYRVFSYLSLLLTLILICVIRYLAIGKILPAGTGGTRVENTFNIKECISFCFQQVFMIFGINIGPEHLVGIEFAKINDSLVKYLTLTSSLLLIVTCAISIIYKIYLITKNNMDISKYSVFVKTKRKKSNDYRATDIDNNLIRDVHIKNKFRLFLPDILFMLFIAMCIGSSSVTIRVEMRFVFVSFTASLLYISYICGFLFNEFDKVNKIVSYIVINFVILLLLVCRVPVELNYRDNYKNIHFFIDLDRVNSIYDNTISKYGLDEILKNRTVYMSNNFFGFTDFYAEWFYKIYDTRNLPIDEKGTKIQLIKNVIDLPKDATNDNSVLLIENIDNFREYNLLPIER